MKLINADCISAMRELEENSMDAIVTDPPYELGFMGKSWDSTGIAFNVEVWQEALRVLKPGGHLLAFSGSRTYHRIAVAIEDAGFEIRDQIMWIYGSGFPKSLDVSKAIDKAVGAEREIVGSYETHDIRNAGLMDKKGSLKIDVTIPSSVSAKQWQGWGTALKPAHEPIVLARKPLIGTVANNVLTYGTGGLNIDATRVGYEEGGSIATNPLLRKQSGAKINYGTDKSPSSFALKTEEGEMNINNNGRWPANIIHDGSDEVVELFPQTTSGKPSGKRGVSNHNVAYADVAVGSDLTGYGDSGSAARFFYCAKASKRDRNEGLDDFEGQAIGAKGNGLARTCATCGSSVLDGCECPDRTFVNPTRANHHPTVKPTDLMRYLCRLVTARGG